MKKMIYFLSALFVVLIDQLSKWWMTEHIIRPNLTGSVTPIPDFWTWLTTGLPEGAGLLPFTQIPVLPFFNIVMIWNKGISFGLLGSGGDDGTMILIALTSVITIAFSVWLFFTKHILQTIALVLVIGGAVGNLVDRLRFGAVIDFLDFHAFGWHYPAFNIADSAIVIGVFLLILYTVFFEKTVSQDA